MHLKRNTARHGRVIDQSGNSLDDTVRFPRLHAVSEIMLRRPDRDDDVSHLLHDGSTRLIPVPGGRSMGMRVPTPPAVYRPNTGPDDLSGVRFMPFTVQPAPGPRVSRARELVRVGFQMTARALDEKVRWLTASWSELARANDRKAADLDARLERLVRRQHAWAAGEEGRLLEEAYREGGTERLMALTPQVLAAMDARAKEMAR